MKTKTLLQLLPELYLVVATIYYWILTANLFNPFAIIFLALLTYQLFYKKSVSGIVIASVLIFVNLYLVLALLSELSEFTKPNDNYTQLIIYGSLFIGLNLIAGSFMLWKYLKPSIEER
ncbi:hypothetical protein [Winogradskyella alexanderae]|uniref:Uncharacterized protein n=1 Tax=Winogradskyella alexanderae TaxID=2877123 RepID=A0ABS7XQN2_9FLAO|nr:hypothetical protein [Winogradskyella alexanderae]MCA0132316.1 hypothetical protein [Winogradskyella alexanderae]